MSPTSPALDQERTERPPEWVRKVPAAARDLHAMKQSPWKHNAINLTAVTLLWAAIAGIIVAGWAAPWFVYIPVGAVLVGCAFFAHFILVIHECSHNMFLLSSDRKRQQSLNRAIGRVAAGMFFTDYLVHWEKGHLIHHLRPCEEDDPQDKDPLTGSDLYKRYAMLLVPGAAAALNPCNQYGFSWRRLLGGVAFWGPLLAVTGIFLGWAVPVMLLFAFNFLSVLNMTKKAQEHGAGLKDEPWPLIRSRTYFYPLARLFSPFNINYHFEHHANFNVPWYLLPAYHERTVELVPEKLRPYYFHREFLAQLKGVKALPPRELLFTE
jgi:fatty acid desaturase